MTRQRLFEILLTALLSALIAGLQTLLSHVGNSSVPPASPLMASAIGASIHAIRRG